MAAFQSLVPASVFVEWRAQPGLVARKIQSLRECSSMCCDLYHVHLQECFFNETVSRHICQFSAPDAESVRTALRAAGVRADSIWAGQIYQRRKQLRANVVIELRLDRQRRVGTVDSLNEFDHEWERLYDLQVTRTLVALDNTRTIFLCHAPNRTAIGRTTAQMEREGMTAWPCRLLTAETG